MVELKNEEQFALMREAGLIVQRTLDALRAEVKDGVTTGRLDAIAEESIRSQDAIPSFKGYGGGDGVPAFPGVICASINNEIVHGIPGQTVVRDGDIISIDCGAIYQGWHGDSAITVACGEVDPALAELMRVTEQSMWHGIAAIQDGKQARRDRPGDPGLRALAGPATASSRATAGTASAPRCTWTRSCTTTGRWSAAPGCGWAWRWPSSRC